MKPNIFLTRELPPKVMERLKEHTHLEMNNEDRVLTKEELIEGVKGKDGLLCLLTDRIDAEIMDANPQLKVIANYAVGFDNIDIQAAVERKIPVTNTPGVLTEASADLAFSLLMATARRIVDADTFVRTKAWKGWGPQQFLGIDIFNSTLGIIGLGRIGKAVVKRARGFDMEILYWNRTRLPEEEERELGIIYKPFEEVIAQSDFLSLHVAYTKDTHHLIGKEEFGVMKETAILINTSRGPVIDEKGLVTALQEGEIRGAGLDVFENEPKIEPGLMELENVVLLPHIASATIATRTKMGMIAVDNLFAALEGKKIPNLVNQEILSL